jgi:hypothetical protein
MALYGSAADRPCFFMQADQSLMAFSTGLRDRDSERLAEASCET